MKNKVLSIMLIIILVLVMFLVTACGENENKENDESKLPVEENENVFTYMDKLDASMTIEKMNDVIGSEGKLLKEGEKYKLYKWELKDQTSIGVQMTTDNNTIITANFPDSMINKKSDFSKWDEIKNKLRQREEITYDEFVKYMGGIEGKMNQKTNTNVTYKWMNEKGGYLSAYFDIKTKKCITATGRIDN